MTSYVIRMAGPLGFELLWAPRHPPPPKRLHAPMLLVTWWAPRLRASYGLLDLPLPPKRLHEPLLWVRPCCWWAPRLQPSQFYGQCGTTLNMYLEPRSGCGQRIRTQTAEQTTQTGMRQQQQPQLTQIRETGL